MLILRLIALLLQVATLNVIREHLSSQLQRLVLIEDNKCSWCQYVVQYQRIVFILPVSVFVVSLVHFMFFKFIYH